MAKTFNEVTETIREASLKEFESLKQKKDKNDLSEDDLDYFLARDRKAALILNTLKIDLQLEVLKLRKGKSIQIGN